MNIRLKANFADGKAAAGVEVVVPLPKEVPPRQPLLSTLWSKLDRLSSCHATQGLYTIGLLGRPTMRELAWVAAHAGC